MTKQTVLTVLFAGLMMGCSAKVGGGDPVGALGELLPQPDTFSHLVDGPVVDGVWRSDCVSNPRGDGYMSVRLTITGQDVARDTQIYVDSQCTKLDKNTSEIGKFRYKALNSAGNLEVEYHFNMELGTYTQYEVFALDGETLWISGLIGGEGRPTIPMVKIDLFPLPMPPIKGEIEP
jgi:hypothetical protein